MPEELRTAVLTCHTPGCGNADHAIPLDVPLDVDLYACGACGEPITDVR